MPPKAIILFYDGHCNLCHRVVRFVAKRDKKQAFSFAPLQGQTAALHLTQEILQLDTVVLKDGGNLHVKSNAVFRVMKLLGFPWSVLYVFRFLPVVFLDKIYDLVATRRFRIWGKRDECEIIPGIQKNRMLK